MSESGDQVVSVLPASVLDRHQGDALHGMNIEHANYDLSDGKRRRVLWRGGSFQPLDNVSPQDVPSDWKEASSSAVESFVASLESTKAAGLASVRWPERQSIDFPAANGAVIVQPRDQYEAAVELCKAHMQIRDIGFTLLRGVDPTAYATEQLCRKLCSGRLQRTVYGEGMWRTEVRDREQDETRSANSGDPSANRAEAAGPGAVPVPVDPETAFNDTAYTSAALRCHTDGNYWNDPPRLQAFHCIQADKDGGGLSVLVDGVAAAERLRQAAPEAFAFFSGVRLPFGHVDADSRFVARHCPITLATHEVAPGREASAPIERIHYNNDDRWLPLAAPEHVRAAVRIREEELYQKNKKKKKMDEKESGRQGTAGASGAPTESGPGRWSEWHGHGRSRSDPLYWRCAPSWAVVEGFYRHLPAWLACYRDPAMEQWLRLLPGDVLVFDNWRVFHGRSGFDTRSERVLSGCYISDDEWRSAVRVAARRVAAAAVDLLGAGAPAPVRAGVVPEPGSRGAEGVVMSWDDVDEGSNYAEAMCGPWQTQRNEPVLCD